MARKIKFALKMSGDIYVRTIEELKHNFDLTYVLEYYLNGKLQEWLSDRQYYEYLDSIVKLDKDGEYFKKSLCEIFDAEYVDNKLEVKNIEQRIEKWKLIKSYTDDVRILDNIDDIVLCQNELDRLLKDDDKQIIYLFGERFVVPLTYRNKTYVGVNDPIVEVDSFGYPSLEEINVRFENIRVLNYYDEVENNKISVCENQNEFSKMNDTIFMLDIGRYYTHREVECKYGKPFAIYRYMGHKIYPTYNRFKPYGSRAGLVIDDGGQNIDIFNIYNYENSNPIFLKGRYIYWLEKFGKNKYCGNLIRYDIETNTTSIILEGISGFVICENRIIYFYRNSQKGRGGYAEDVSYDVMLNNLNFNDEKFLFRSEYDYYKIKEQYIDTVYHEYASFKWKEEPFKIEGLTVNILDIDHIIECFDRLANEYSWMLYDTISIPLERRGIKRYDCIEVTDIQKELLRDLYSEFLDGMITLKGQDDYERYNMSKFTESRIEIVNDNSSVRNMVDNNGICNLKLFLEWLKVHDIKVEKRMVEILESV